MADKEIKHKGVCLAAHPVLGFDKSYEVVCYEFLIYLLTAD